MIGGNAQEGEQHPPCLFRPWPSTSTCPLPGSLGQSKSYVHLRRQGPASPCDRAGEAGKGW